jgi:hypothetical protein
MIRRNTSQTVNCPVCNHVQTEINLSPDDKFAWFCQGCHALIENDRPHLLQQIARFCFPRNGGGNVCTGFGGLPGEIRHKGYILE